jgi:hypothetical protein
MIKSAKGRVQLSGRECQIVGDLGTIFCTIMKYFGENKGLHMINYALEETKKLYSEDCCIETEELKNIIKEKLPKEISKILLELI